MGTWFHRILVVAYVAVIGLFILILLRLAGVHISNYAGWGFLLVWMSICFGTGSIAARIQFFRKLSCRLPIRSEEEKIQPVLKEVLAKAFCQKKIQVLIEEESEWNAYAIGRRTIVISKGLLRVITEEELKGLMAHELGHLLTGDTIMASAFVTAGLLPRLARPVFRWARWLILIYIVFRLPVIWAVGALILFLFLFRVVDPVFSFLVRGLGRLSEYRQDAWAHHLGYGHSLRLLLEKIAGAGNQEVNPYYIMMRSTHPGIYNRIRRLENLEKSTGPDNSSTGDEPYSKAA